MPEYIEREALITLIDDKQTEGYELCMPMELKSHYVAGLQKAKQIVERAPAADVVEVKHGQWHLLYNCANEGVYCSVCNKKVYKTDYANQKIKSPFCPNCGAKMDLKEGAESG